MAIAFKVENITQGGEELTRDMVEETLVVDLLERVGGISVKEMPTWDEEGTDALEKRVKELEDIAEQAVRELDHYADNSTDPDMIDKVSDLVEVLRKAITFRQTPRDEGGDGDRAGGA